MFVIQTIITRLTLMINGNHQEILEMQAKAFCYCNSICKYLSHFHGKSIPGMCSFLSPVYLNITKRNHTKALTLIWVFHWLLSNKKQTQCRGLEIVFLPGSSPPSASPMPTLHLCTVRSLVGRVEIFIFFSYIVLSQYPLLMPSHSLGVPDAFLYVHLTKVMFFSSKRKDISFPNNWRDFYLNTNKHKPSIENMENVFLQFWSSSKQLETEGPFFNAHFWS